MNESRSDSDVSVSIGDEDFSDASSSSSDGSSVSSSSSSSSANNDECLDLFELAKITKEVLRLPRGLCENSTIFHEFFSVESWNDLPESIRAHMEQHLPRFSHLVTPQEAALERQRSLTMLFNGELRRFGHSPLIDLQHQLEEGNCRPDVLRLRQRIAKSRRHEQRFQRCERLSQLAKQLFLSRERLMRTAYKSAPDTVIRAERNIKREQSTLYADTKLCTVRSRKRFRQELEQISEQSGLNVKELSAEEEESVPDEAMEDLQRNVKMEGSLGLKSAAPAADRFIFSTLFKRRRELTDEEAVRADQHIQQIRLSNRNFRSYLREHKRRKLTEPTLADFETSDIRLRDVCTRAQMGSNFKHLFGSGKAPGRKPKSKLQSVTEVPALVPIQSVEPHGITSRPVLKESVGKQDLESIQGSEKKLKELQKSDHFHQHLSDHPSAAIQHPYLPEDGAPFNILDGEVELQQEEVETYGTCEETLSRFVISNEVVLPTIEHCEVPPQKLLQTPHKDEALERRSKEDRNNIPKLEPLHAILNKTPHKEKIRSHTQLSHIANTPATANAVIVTPIKRSTQSTTSTKSFTPASFNSATELIQETHACFFSLIRDLFCATAHHRMQYNELRSRIGIWLCNPITALNDWYAQADNWSALLMSAINFLAGDFADQPEEYVPYVEFKPQQNIYQWIGAGRDSDTHLSSLCSYWLQRRNDVPDHTPAGARQNVLEDTFEITNDMTILPAARRTSIEIEESTVSYDGGVSPPPPPPPRYPTTWTVCVATAEEVVEFQRQERERFEQPHRAYTYRMHNYESVVGPVKGIYTQMYALTKARGHSMMIVNRPNFVTILTLVRDATARLPNGEGTRADIAELLKSSQYINLKDGENVLQTTVSGALDRMHTEHDPCVRYDPKRKIWIYLHRNRSEEDFERIHQQQQGLGKSKKVVQRKPKAKSTAATKLTSESTDGNAAQAPGDKEGNMGVVNVVTGVTKSSTPFSMPALVPSNPIIVSNQGVTTQHKVSSTIVRPPLSRSLPVPPLKYNIPHQQQKSLLKSTVQSHTQTQRQQEHRQVNNTGNIELQHQRVQLRVANVAKNSKSNDTVAEECITNKHYSLTVSPTKSTLPALSAGVEESTPIIVATPTGLQTVRVSNAAVVTSSTVTSVSASGQQNSPLSATLGSKKVALNKPIIINQIRGQSTITAASRTKSTLQQVFKQQNNTHHQQHQQQSQSHGFIIPISMANAITAAAGVDGQAMKTKESNVRGLPSLANEGATTIYMDNSQLICNAESPQQESQLKPTQAKNIIRLVPSIGGSAVKSLLQATATSAVGAGSKQPVHVIGHRVANNCTGSGTVRAQSQQAKSIGNISLISSSSCAQTSNVASVVTAATGSTLIKMSPQTYATLQQKQGQQIVVKQASTSSNVTSQQQRVVENAAIVTQSTGSTTQTLGKKIFMQQTSTTAAIQKAVGVSATSVASQTSVSAAVAAAGRVHSINTTNLTPQQQRVLLQNIKQQQQQNIQFKTVQVVSSGTTKPQSQTQQGEQSHINQQQIHQLVTRPQTLTVLPPHASGGLSAGQRATGKAVAVMVSQPQGLTRVLKTNSSNAQTQQQQSITITATESAGAAATTGGTRILTTATGQIISLESLLQKQSSSGALKISSSGTVSTVVKNVQSSNVTQQPHQQSQLAAPSGNATTYTLVSQARNTNAQRTTTTQATDGGVTTAKTTMLSGGTGRIVMSAGGQLTAPQIAKVLGKSGMTSNSVANTSTGGNIRVIKNAANVSNVGTSFNIANLQGKQVVFATKPASSLVKKVGHVVQGQQLQTTGMVIGGQTVKLHRNAQQHNKGTNSTTNSSSSKVGVIATQSGTQMQTVIVGNQILRVQQMPTATVKSIGNESVTQQRIATLPVGSVITNNATSGSVVMNRSSEAITNAATMNLPKTLVLGSGGQTIRLQQSQQTVQVQHQQHPISAQTQAHVVSVKNAAQQGAKTSNTNRVVLAMQGGGQIFLSPNFQGNTLNLKSLQNMKVVSLTPRNSTGIATQQLPQDKATTVTQNSGGGNTS